MTTQSNDLINDKSSDEESFDELFDGYVNLINVFIIYYNKTHKRKENIMLLNDINITDPSSTNNIMEDFFVHIKKYKECADDKTLTKLYDSSDKTIDYNKEKELYELTIEDKTNEKKIPIKFYSRFILPLLKYLVEEDIWSDPHICWDIKHINKC